MSKVQVEINGYDEVLKWLKKGPVWVKCKRYPEASRLLVRDVRRVNGCLEIEVLEGWLKGPYEVIWIECEKQGG